MKEELALRLNIAVTINKMYVDILMKTRVCGSYAIDLILWVWKFCLTFFEMVLQANQVRHQNKEREGSLKKKTEISDANKGR